MLLFFSRLSCLRGFLILFFLVCFGWTSLVNAESEVRIDIFKAPNRKIKIALPTFFGTEHPMNEAEEMRKILARDLAVSGFFEVMTNLPKEMILDGLKGISHREVFDELAAHGVELLVNVHDQSREGNVVLEGFVFDPSSRRQVFGKRYRSLTKVRTKLVHTMAGEIIQKFTGVEPLTESRLAFLLDTSGKKQVFVSDYDAQNQMAVSSAGDLSLFPEWLPDGRSLVYTSFATGFPKLVYKDVQGGHEKILTSYPGMNANVSFSPDGKNFLATLSKDGNPEIYKLDLRGDILQRLTYNQSVDTSPCFSPSGREFAFVSDRSGGPKIYIMSSEGGNPTRLTFKGHYNVSPDWSPNGKYIAYSSLVNRRFQIMLINPLTKEVIQVTDGPGNKEDPAWGRDNRHLVFTLTKGYKSDLYMIDIYSKEMTQITKKGGNFTSPTWSDVNP